MPAGYYRDKFACPFGCPMFVWRNKWASHIIKWSNASKPTLFVCKYSMYHIFTIQSIRDNHVAKWWVNDSLIDCSLFWFIVSFIS